MALEDLTGTKYINSLVATNPTSSDNKSEGDDHIRGLKNVILKTFPNVAGAITASHSEINYADGPNAANKFCLLGSDAKVPAAQAPAFRGAFVYKSANQSIATATPTAVTFNSESYDTSGIHDTVTNNTRLTVPSGVTRVRLTGSLSYDNIGGTYYSAMIYKNGSNSYVGVAIQTTSSANGCVVISPTLTVTAGDYFELYGYHNVGSTINIPSSTAWFSMEIVE